jgi:hypothetical protein
MKNNHFLINILAIILLSTFGYSQPVTWYRTWGLYNRSEQSIRAVQTFDGGYASLVQVGYGGSNDFCYLLKYDGLGNFLWSKIIVDTTSRMLYDMKQTSDSGFVFAGYTLGALLIKTDKNGNLKWQKNYPNLNPGTEFNSVQQTKDKGYIACGSYTDYSNPSEKGIVIKTDSLGYIQWEKPYLDSLFTGYVDVIQGIDGKFYITGSTHNSYPSISYALVKKIDSLGNFIWMNIYYANGGGGDLMQLKDGSLIVGGVNFYTSSQPILAKLDTNGNTKWAKFYPSPVMHYYSMCKDISDNICITGYQDLQSTISNWKLDTSGTLLKIKNLSFSGYNLIGSFCIKSTLDTGYIISGEASTLYGDALIIKTDSAFNTPIITGINNISYQITDEFEVYQNYPNPFNSSTSIKFYIPKSGNVKLKIYDITGREIKTLVNEIKNPGSYIVTFNGTELASGVYFYRIQSGDFVQVKKMVLIK